MRETQAEQQKRLDDLENTTIKMSKTRSKSDSKQAHVSVKVEVEEMKSQLIGIDSKDCKDSRFEFVEHARISPRIEKPIKRL